MNITAEEFLNPGAWYTSYPSLEYWSKDFKYPTYIERLRSFLITGKPVHIYVHIPFCKKLCSYCICGIVISNDRQKIQFFLDHLLKEIDLLEAFYRASGAFPYIREVQFGGGTPSHLDRIQFRQLCEKLGSLVNLKSLDELAMEIDPRTVTQEDLRLYAEMGVTRISFGIQDFDPKVQKAINREQPYELIADLLTPEIRKLFRGVNFDLLYGLPFQTHKTIEDTIEKVKSFHPERITLLKYCHAPEIRKHMRLINVTDLPPDEELPVMFMNLVKAFTDFGYQWIGLDHFAKPTDELALAQLHGTVGRTFNGFTPGRTRDMIGLGPTTTGAFGETYSQSVYDLHDYYNAINRREFPVFRGYELSYDDSLRREVIFDILCNQRVDFRNYGNYFNRELGKLEGSELCNLRNGVLTVTQKGRYLLRNICKVFDHRSEHKISQFPITRRAALVA